MTEIASFLERTVPRLASKSDSPRLDAQVLTAHILKRPRAWVLAHPEFELSRTSITRLESAVHRLEFGMPLAYVIGQREFFGLDFFVSPTTLIPRPETELLVEHALDWLNRQKGKRLVVDVGTGSGCIAISIAVNHPDVTVTASDISLQALRVAQKNAEKHGVSGRVACVQSDLLPPISWPFDLVCANLPYIPTEVLWGLEISGKEPTIALDGGPDGLRTIRRLLASIQPCIAPGGLILLEIESTQAEATLELARLALLDADVQVFRDLSGLDRLVAIQLA